MKSLFCMFLVVLFCSATFHAAYLFLLIGVVLKLIKSRFLFFVPAYVSFSVLATPLQHSMIAFAGPAVNAVLWLGSELIWRKKLVNKKYTPMFFLMAKINMFLFIFNMLPIPGFDGSHVFSGLLSLL